MTRAIYRFNAEKAFTAVHWMTKQAKPVDIHAGLKACYFADKSHLNEHFQPIFGARYRAMKFGPVPLEIYEIMKGESIWLWEVGLERTPWELRGYKLCPSENHEPDMSIFSESELSHLEAGFERSTRMTFTARTAATHGKDWQAANGGQMLYEDMLDERENKPEIVQWMQESARHIRL